MNIIINKRAHRLFIVTLTLQLLSTGPSFPVEVPRPGQGPFFNRADRCAELALVEIWSGEETRAKGAFICPLWMPALLYHPLAKNKVKKWLAHVVQLHAMQI